LVNPAGEVVGINTSGIAMDASFAIPARLAWKLARQLAEHGSLKHGFLGVRSQVVALPPASQTALGWEQSTGLLLVDIEEGSSAESGGLMVGDILVAIQDQPVADPDDLFALLSGDIVGQTAPVQVLRGGKPLTLPVSIGERPELSHTPSPHHHPAHHHKHQPHQDTGPHPSKDHSCCHPPKPHGCCED
jgi:S1-C subfamily serine protease